MMEIIWKPIKNYEGIYEISNTGSVRSIAHIVVEKSGLKLTRKQRGKILRQFINAKSEGGYFSVALSRGGEVKKFLVHRLLAAHFISNPKNKPCINHIDGNKLNNDIKNLEWVTFGENNSHAYRNGLKAPVCVYGEKQWNHKLKADEVLKIRKLRNDFGYKLKDLAEMFSMSIASIQQIAVGKAWRHI